MGSRISTPVRVLPALFIPCCETTTPRARRLRVEAGLSLVRAAGWLVVQRRMLRYRGPGVSWVHPCLKSKVSDGEKPEPAFTTQDVTGD